MNKKLAFLAAPLIMLAASTTVKADSNCDFRPYIGADAQIRHMPFKKGYGNLPLDSNYPQGNLFVGAQINKYIGIEWGYESSFKKSKLKNLAGVNAPFSGADPVFIANQDSIFGNYLDVSDLGRFPITIAAKNKITGWNLNVTGTLPICEAECLDLIASVGFSRIRTRVELAFPRVNGVVNDFPGSVNYFKFSHNYKTIPRLMIGLQKMMTCHAGIRFTVGWEPTSKLNDLKLYQQPGSVFFSQDNGAPVFTARLNDSINYGIGLFWRF